MKRDEPSDAPPAAPAGPRAHASLRPALALIALVLLARVVYLVAFCRYDLVEDEAHYWLWSRHLDWSYYSKGPGIAWAIGLSTAIFGHAEWAVRLPTAIAGAIGALACGGLARDIARRAFVNDGSVATPARAAVFAAAAYTLAPAYQLTGFLITIDGSYLACWAMACWMGWRAMVEGSRRAWVGLGAALGLGFLFKYTILLLIPGLVLFAWLTRRGRGDDRLSPAPRWRPWLMLGLTVFLLGLAPVLIWNAREGWPTVKHLLGHLGLRGGDMPLPAAPPTGQRFSFNALPVLTYLASPLGMIGPSVLIALVAIRRVMGRRERPGRTPARRLGVRFLTCMFLPIFLFYLAVSFMAEPEQNWAIAGFVPLCTLAGWFAADEITRRRAGARLPHLTDHTRFRTRPVKVLWRLTLFYGLGAAIVLHAGPQVADGLNALARTGPVSSAITAITGREPRPIVLGRAMGAGRMAAHVRRVVEALDTRFLGSRPFVMCEHYGRASQMAYYLNRSAAPAGGAGPAPIPVLSPQSAMGGRRSQFDFWPDTALRRPDLLGQPAVLMSNDKPVTLERWRALFDAVEPLDTPDQKLDGEHKKDRVAFIGLGYRGVAPPLPTPPPTAPAAPGPVGGPTPEAQQSAP